MRGKALRRQETARISLYRRAWQMHGHLKYARLKRWQGPAPAGISRYQPVSSGQSKWASQACPTGTMAMSCAGRDQPVSACIVRPVMQNGHLKHVRPVRWQCPAPAGISRYQPVSSGLSKWAFQACSCALMQWQGLAPAGISQYQPVGEASQLGTPSMSDRCNDLVLHRQESTGISLYCQASQSGQLKHALTLL